MTNALPTALIVVCIDTHFVEMIRVARLLVRSGKYRPIMIFAHDYKTMHRDLEVCQADGIEYLEIHRLISKEDQQDTLKFSTNILKKNNKFALIHSLFQNTPHHYPYSLVIIARTCIVLLGLLFYDAWTRPYNYLATCVVFCKKTASFIKKQIFYLTAVFLVLYKISVFGIKKIYRIFTKWTQLEQIFSTTMSTMQVYREIIRRYNAKIVILPEDNVGYISGVTVKVAKSMNAATCIVPFTRCNAKEPAQYFAKNFKQYSSIDAERTWLRRVVARIWPTWVHRHCGHTMFRMPMPYIFLHEILRISPPCPWQMNSGHTDTLLVESDNLRDFYINNGIPASKILVTGSLADDEIAAVSQAKDSVVAKLVKETSIRPDLPLLVCGFPPSQFPLDCEFASYRELVEFWIASFASLTGWNVVLRLHPRMDEKEFKEQYDLKGIFLSTLDTASLISICDLYVASISATIRWAIASGKPVINYDVYQMDYDDFITAQGVVNIKTKEGFVRYLHKLTENPDVLQDYARRQRDGMRQWGYMDGNNGQRLFKAIDDLVVARGLR